MPATSRILSALSAPALLLLCLSADAQAPPAQPSPPIQIQVPPQQDTGVLTLHANSRAVLLDVVVTDGHGHAVHGLKPENFRVFEDGKPQVIASLEEHHPPTATELASEPKLPPLGPNTFSNRKQPATGPATTVFLLDALDSPLPAQMYARDQLLEWVGSMQPGTQVAIFQLDSQLHLIQGFTSDPAVLKSAIKERYKPVLAAIPRGGFVAAQFQMDALTAAMQSLGAYLQTRPGRKNLVWFTAHIPRSVYDSGTAVGGSLHDSEIFLFDYSKATDALVLGEVSVYPIDTRGLQGNPAFSAANGGRPKNPGSFTTRQFFQHTDLDEVAEATGGKAFYNTNGIKQVVSEVIETGSSYYTLSFYPTNKTWDGSYRNLKVEGSSTSVSGLQLEYRRGYYAQKYEGPRPEPPQTTAAAGRIQLTHSATGQDQAAFAAAMHLGAIDPGQIIFGAHVNVNPAVEKISKDQPLPKDNFLEAKYRDHPFRNYQVTYVVPGSQLQLALEANGLRKGSVELVTLVTDDKGTLVNSVISSVDMDVTPETYALLMSKGLQMPVTIAVPEKGTYFLRLGVHDRSTGKAGALEFSAGDVQITP